MRISDWSSDVCSSDLRDGGEVDAEIRQLDGAVQRMEEALQRVADDRRLLEDLFLHEVAVLALADQRAGQRGLPHPALDRPVLGVVHRRARFGELDPRSEEHTSELHSLMRHPYAVFCLNKKTQHTHT